MGFAILGVEVEITCEFRLIEFKTQQNRIKMWPNRNIATQEIFQMQKQSLFFAASIAIMLVMASVGQAQSYHMGSETYGQVVWVEQGMVQQASVMPVGVRVDSIPVYAPTPAPPIPLGETQATTAFVSPAMPVLIDAPVQHVLPPAQHFLPPVQQVLPITTIQQPVCLSGG